jgi:ribosomal protein L11 methyltransferase
LGSQGCYNQENILRTYFYNSDWSEKKRNQFQNYLHQLAELQFPVQADKIQFQKIENQDWNAQWKQSIKPIEIGNKILIKPTWINIEPALSKEIIEIDPQMAFGTGVHATTQLMLKLLIDHIGSPARIMDMGTGTGILAIAAARLSNARIIAFDNDPVATGTARQNCLKNSVLEKIHIFCGTIDVVKDTRFDLIMININRSIIIESLSKIFRCLNETGLAIFSGILIDEKKQFIENVKKHDFKIVKEAEQGEWVGIVVSGM